VFSNEEELIEAFPPDEDAPQWYDDRDGLYPIGNVTIFASSGGWGVAHITWSSITANAASVEPWPSPDVSTVDPADISSFEVGTSVVMDNDRIDTYILELTDPISDSE